MYESRRVRMQVRTKNSDANYYRSSQLGGRAKLATCWGGPLARPHERQARERGRNRSLQGLKHVQVRQYTHKAMSQNGIILDQVHRQHSSNYENIHTHTYFALPVSSWARPASRARPLGPMYTKSLALPSNRKNKGKIVSTKKDGANVRR
jgi:hypothetical protein